MFTHSTTRSSLRKPELALFPFNQTLLSAQSLLLVRLPRRSFRRFSRLARSACLRQDTFRLIAVHGDDLVADPASLSTSMTIVLCLHLRRVPRPLPELHVSAAHIVRSSSCHHAHRHAGRQARTQVGTQAGRHTGMQAGRQADRQTGMHYWCDLLHILAARCWT